ncbi:UNVERIFIED_CONTAM: hypothetical protein Scaly_2011600 [Sesamum calycinum]|uniref:Avr9/Cf-9 rapidly elicited protein 146 n=1 Tax=Sesamum calycinum TaxID=2727403 RepID=A0AAW2N0X4_9LAMI
MEMEMEKSPPEIAKKLWNIVRIVFYMMRKSLAKSKIMLDLHMLLKRGKLASKAAIGNLMLHHHHNHNYYSALTCRSNDVTTSFISPESTSSAAATAPPTAHPSAETTSTATTNRIMTSSPVGRQLRVTDSPFPVKDPEENHQVDRDCEEFIKKFYKDLKNQKRIAALESPSPYHIRAR